MLEAITDFWKPVKKNTPPRIKLTDMQIGTVVSFGYVPQVLLSGRKLKVTAINSYQFGKDVLTSFVLSGEQGSDVSMIIAEAQGEQYLAISRRLTPEDKTKLFEKNSIDAVTGKEEVGTFMCRDNIPELKGWLVGGYKREIHGMRGYIHHKDFRNGNDGSHSGKEFMYCLLGSSSNEHAIEIESYQDGHVDVYATIYRRTSDITEVQHSDTQEQPEKVPVLNIETKAAPVKQDKPLEKADDKKVVSEPVIEIKAPVVEAKVEVKPEIKAEAKPEETLKDKVVVESSDLDSVKLELMSLPEMIITPLAPEIKKTEIVEPVLVKPEPVKAEPAKTETKPVEIKIEPVKSVKENDAIKNNNEEKKNMSTATNENKITGTNGVAGSNKEFIQEIKTMTKAGNGMEGDSIECELRVANQIIDEAIRNEMRLSDVVRRIIELPVSHQEAVHIPITLADEDYALLAIRYGISASDRNAIKLRIIQDLADFSGSKKKVN